MGQAKQKKLGGVVISWCRGCTLCCELPDIPEMGKAAYHRCQWAENKACGVYATRPEVCRTFQCRYVMARSLVTADRHHIPHPNDSGAYFIELYDQQIFVVFVDPDRPEIWKKSDIVRYLEKYISAGFKVLVVDRGYRFSVAHIWEQYLSDDWVEVAKKDGRALDVATFASRRQGE